VLCEGDALDTHDTGNPSTGSAQAFTFGYLVGVMDAATGLLYVGNGQYYDPETGRFLTRDAKSNNTNPYVPWNPIGAIIGPLGLISLFYNRKNKGSKAGTLLVLVLVVVTVSMILAACGGGGSNNQQQS
jgi:RHS repeat-associated protein